MQEYISNSSFLKPAFLRDSAWLQHIPFAFWLAEKLRPQIFIELGVHTGASYFSFCQSFQHNEVKTVCYGVDTWTGDEHAGFYSEEIYQDAAAYNDANYSGFSYLLRHTFSEALQNFEDDSIGLLHIDGCHTYEAVHQDFFDCLPKLSANAIVLFHDINVRKDNFGVHKLWSQLKEQYPNFEFEFGYGLGVLAPCKKIPEALNFLFSPADSKLQYNVQLAYEKLGLAIIDTYRLAQISARVTTLQNKLHSQETQMTQLEEKTNNLTVINNTLKNENEKLSAQLLEVEEQNTKAQKENEEIIGWYHRTYEERSLPGIIIKTLGTRFKKKD